MSVSQPSTPDDGTADLDILHPEREIEVGGQTIVVREYGFVEGLRLAGKAAPVVQSLARVARAQAVDDALFSYAGIQSAFADHTDEVLDMVAQACDQPRAFVDGLSPADGELLMLTWWAVNGPFFVRRVAMDLQMEQALDRAGSHPGGAPSTPASSTPDTEAESASASTPTAS